MRTILGPALVAAVFVTGCGIATSTSQPIAVAPTLAPGEQPVRTVSLSGSVGHAPLNVRIYDRSLALAEARSATRAELAALEPIDANAIGAAETTDGEILITWTGTACPGVGDILVGAGASEITIVPGSVPGCAAGESLRGVYLRFEPSVGIARIAFALARPAPS